MFKVCYNFGFPGLPSCSGIYWVGQGLVALLSVMIANPSFYLILTWDWDWKNILKYEKPGEDTY